MARTLRQRATAIVDWDTGSSRGVLVHADHHGNWLLPGGKVEGTAGGHETPLIAAARELREEVGLKATGAVLLFHHTGKYNLHHVYLTPATGTPRIVAPGEAPAIGVCTPDLHVTWLVKLPGFSVADLTPMSSSQAIIQRYFALRDQHPALWEGLSALEVNLRESGKTSAPAPAAGERSGTSTRPARRHQGRVTRFQVGDAILELTRGDIVTQDVDAVVNAANTHLANGTGVCGALHRGAGEYELEAACRAIGGCPTGEARITPGFRLRAGHIIHAVGPIYKHHRPDEAQRLLASAYRASLELASQQGLRSIAFPSLSTGVYGYPIDKAAPVALEAVISAMHAHRDIQLVRFVLRDDTWDSYEWALKRLVAHTEAGEVTR